MKMQEDDDDGPPPGFQCIISRQPPPQSQPAEEINKEEEDEEDEDEGPPPGFEPVAPNSSSPPPSSSDMEGKNKEDEIDDGEDDEGPPPGWEFGALMNQLPKPTSNTTSDIKTESNEELDEGPPPGWETVMPRQMPPPCTPPLQSSSSMSPSVDIASKQEIMRNYNEVPPPVSQSKPTSGHSLLPTPPLSEVSIGEFRKCYRRNKLNNKKVRIKRPISGYHLSSPLQQPRPNSRPLSQPIQPSSSRKAQLVCGTCRTLCLYPRGAKWVKCPSCQEVNFVLEAHEVGQVKCGSCEVLLMYLHGAPAVQCTSCHFVTEIEAQNSRPPLSVQQAQKLGRHANWAR
ncbi:Protein LOL2 [Striga hermonthica]|uniref:Protein LOL2 n=1 Tax=Striga hermonthica TaxID=68872 RepID=A0A9N7NKB6_STRHE|nr:Protein LOL2 [Striga hermonthica]